MKPTPTKSSGRLAIGLFGVLLVVGIVFGFVRRDRRAPQPGPPVEQRATPDPANGASESGTAPANMDPGAPTPASAAESENAKIQFRGRVLDQDERPLANVDVRVRVARVGFTPDPTKFVQNRQFQFLTGPDGAFALPTLNGQAVYIEQIERGGYLRDPAMRMNFSYRTAAHRASIPPVVDFYLWKQRGAEPTVRCEGGQQGVPLDGTPLPLQLLTGRSGKQVSGEPDVVFRFERQPRNFDPRGPRFDWHLEVRSVGGGLQATTNRFRFWAPDTGYVDAFRFGHAATDPDWAARETVQLYLRTRTGAYARMQLEVIADRRSESVAGIHWDCVLNPSGSRNLEYDSLLLYQPPSTPP